MGKKKVAAPTTAPVVKAAAPKTEGGRGKKFCPACQESMGVRTQKCECGYEFPVKAAGGGKRTRDADWSWEGALNSLKAKCLARMAELPEEMKRLEEEGKELKKRMKALGLE